MIYIVMVFLAAVSYHTLSYGIYLIKKEKNILAAVGVISIAFINLAAPVFLLIFKY